MDRRFVAVLIFLAASFAQAQDPKPSAPPDDPALPPRFQEGNRKERHGKDDKEWLRRKLERMSPKEQERFKKNYEKWKKLPPEEREKLRKRGAGQGRREFFKRAVEEALAKTGLVLSPEDREAFARRYGEERRQLEHQLREEMERRRQELLPEILDRLKAEFSSRNQSQPTTPPPSPSASTAGSGS